MERITIIGADGIIGTGLANAFVANGISPSLTTRRPASISPARIYVNLEEPGPWSLPQTDIAYIVAAMTRLSDCRQDESRARRINIDGAVNIARQLVELGAFIVFLSTSQVFAGNRPFPSAEVKPNPISVYGRLKAEAEARILDLSKDVAVVRLAKVVGLHLTVFQNWLTDLPAGRVIRAFGDLIIAPVALSKVVATLVAIGTQRAGGIWHLSALDEVSYSRVALHIADRLGVSPKLVRETSAAENGIPESERPPHPALRSSNFGLVDIDPPSNSLAEIDLGLSLRNAVSISVLDEREGKTRA